MDPTPVSPPSRREATARLVSLVPVLAGLAASAALCVDYLRPVPVFCAEGSSCDAIKHTPFSSLLGVPLPVIGLAGFLALGAVVLSPGRTARKLQVGLAAGAALAGALLLVLQLLMGELCPYCVTADSSALLSLLAASWWLMRGEGQPGPAWMRWAGPAACAAAAVLPVLWGLFAPVFVPAAIKAEMAATPPGKLTVVDFVDFECPFCRMTNDELEPVLEAHKDRLRVVRRQVPLRMHPHAPEAARAACCGEKLGKGDAMAASLFAADPDSLTPDGCQKLAEKLGVSGDAFKACVVDPSTDAEIEADRAEFKAAGGKALPTIWIGRRQLVGARSREEIAKVIDEELAATGG